MKNVSKKLLIAWAASFAAVVLCVLAVVLDCSAVLTLSDGARNAVGVAVAAALVVFGYTGCKYAGLLKGQKKK